LKRIDELSVGIEICYWHYYTVAVAVEFSGARCRAPMPAFWRNSRR
jgi:hypothetical protein